MLWYGIALIILVLGLMCCAYRIGMVHESEKYIGVEEELRQTKEELTSTKRQLEVRKKLLVENLNKLDQSYSAIDNLEQSLARSDMENALFRKEQKKHHGCTSARSNHRSHS